MFDALSRSSSSVSISDICCVVDNARLNSPLTKIR